MWNAGKFFARNFLITDVGQKETIRKSHKELPVKISRITALFASAGLVVEVNNSTTLRVKVTQP